jgi:hypothetical protein
MTRIYSSPIEDRQSERPFGMSPDELLYAAGPSDAKMSLEQQWAYTAPSLQAEILERQSRETSDRAMLGAVVALINLVLEFPGAAKTEGIPALARRWGEPDDVIELADRCADFVERTFQEAAGTEHSLDRERAAEAIVSEARREQKTPPIQRGALTLHRSALLRATDGVAVVAEQTRGRR